MHRLVLIAFLWICSICLANAQEIQSELIIGEWKLVKNEAIDKIRASKDYLSANPEKRIAMEERIRILMANTFYKFMDQNQLNFTDLERGDIVQRKAEYSMEGNMLTIKETNRDRVKKARVIQLDEKNLILAPVINGQEQESKMIFERWK